MAGGELVLVCGRDPYAAISGSESFALGVARAANDLGLRPHVFAVGAHAELREEPEATVHVAATRMRPLRNYVTALHHRRIEQEVVAFLAGREGPHVVHGFGSWTGPAAAAARTLRRRGVPARSVGSLWTTVQHEGLAKLRSTVVLRSPRLLADHLQEAAVTLALSRHYERRALRAADLLLVNYESVRTLVAAAYGPGLPVRRTTYASPLAYRDGEPRDPPSFPGPAAPLILSVSRHDGRKGLDVLLRALALLRDRGIPFRACLAGPGKLLEAHRALAGELGLDGRVAIPGRVDDVLAHLEAADVYVLPSREEGSGALSILEALQCGAPVVASAVDGIPEDITHGEHGLLVPPGDAAALADALAALLADPARRARLGAAGRARYEERFSPAAAAAELGAVWAELGLSYG